MKTQFSVLLLFLTLLTGCVTVYYPVNEPAMDDYYAAQDSPVTSSFYYGRSPMRYSDMGYYPWWSMDYFYLGYHPYSYWRSAYYSPYFYPRYYSDFYPPRHWYFQYGYSGYYAWYDPYWHHYYRYHGPMYDGDRQLDSIPVDDRYTGGPGSDPGLRRRMDERSLDRETMNRDYRTPRQQEPSGGQRRVAVAPSAGSSRRSMVILKPADQKDRRVRIQPVQPSGLTATVTPPPAMSTPAPGVISNRSAGVAVTSGRRSTTHARTNNPARSVPSRSMSAPARSSTHQQAPSRSQYRPSSSGARTDRD